MTDYNPETNENVISLIKQEDGNWKGYHKRFSKLIEVREAKPEDCLLRLMTHDGN